jgi:hypothetical protein
MSIAIQNCGWTVKFQCPRTWDDLQATDDPYVRLCGTCVRQVFRCDSDTEVRNHAKQGHCVAVFISNEFGTESAADFLGDVSET